MAEIMFVRMPAALLLGALLGGLATRWLPRGTGATLGVAALVLASLAMPFWMLPVMMDRAAAWPAYAAGRDLSLAATGAALATSYATWAPVVRHLWVLEQVAMLVRYAVWYGWAPAALCTAWDADVQQGVGRGLLAAAAVLAAAYLALQWRAAASAHAAAPHAEPSRTTR